MATSKKFSELPAASSVGNGDLFAIAHEDALAETGYVSQKLTAAQAGQKVNGDTEYPTSLPSFPENGQNPFAALEKLNQDIIDLYPVSTASGSIATFSTSLALPLVECKAEIVAQQAGSGTPSPSNPRAISGFSSVSLTHNAETKTIALGQTVYGGVLDAKNGKLVVTYGIIDLGDLNWTKYVHPTLGEYYYADAFALGLKYQGAYTSPYNNICEAYPVVGRTAGAFVDFSLTFDGSVSRVTQIQIKNSNCSDGTEMKNALNGVHLCFQLATPTSITGLTGANFTTIADQENNIFADCGDISVSFKQGIQEYIDAKIAETQALIL